MHHSRRNLLGLASGGIAGLGLIAASPALAQTTAANAAAPTGMSPDQALDLLKAGNAAFQTDSPVRAATGRARRLEIAQGQHPFAVYVSCSDSRVSPEILFGRGLGELFIVRNAGNMVDTAAMGSIEYAVSQFGTPLIVVMGHERCGAVAAALSVVDENRTFPGSIGTMLEPIIPAVLAARGEPGDRLNNCVRANVRRTVARLRTASSDLLLEPQRQGRLKVVGADYDLDTGAVDFFDVS